MYSLESNENQFGKEIVTCEIERVGICWQRHTMVCRNSYDYGFGTCQCHSHSTWGEEILSMDEGLSLLAEKMIVLNAEDEVFIQRWRQLPDQVRTLIQKLPNGVERWIEQSYMLNLNPLPQLRKLLGEDMTVLSLGDHLVISEAPDKFSVGIRDDGTITFVLAGRTNPHWTTLSKNTPSGVFEYLDGECDLSQVIGEMCTTRRCAQQEEPGLRHSGHRRRHSG
ncbi:MAG: hypothetical protein NTZ18_00170 [Candidatus Komeilibacteria bacterium]|nr:hypothetical protein [Candidatus Komeilibacteria bacterium]